ncbi:predicted protein [Naegleria gruberi]|uniref:Predicted protein n=1 Tax=Naegleria gruberi TaxID=5762 RepID=D2W1U4_NAEGR|nr:uncharacterized protein NAEGRDRAFT_75381 [Naegleria gruberi]EFC37028.1 predicted protein [Naegleria gruberi]|eukprot:XP_002669772.1 predicted protein [Naegleria gruberi strain NEG-M]
MLKIYHDHANDRSSTNHQEPFHIVNTNTCKTINIPNFERIKKVVINQTSVHVLSESGQVYIFKDGFDSSSSSSNIPIQVPYLLDTTTNGKLLIEDVSTFSEGSTLYLVRDEMNNTFLYGSGSTAYDCFGGNRHCMNEDGTEKFTLLYTPPTVNGYRHQITHIASCYSFTIIVLDYCDIRISGQDWVHSVHTVMGWHVSQFCCEKKIKKIECGSFQFFVIFEDDTVMFCGDNGSNQMPHTEGTAHFSVDYEMKISEAFGGYDCSVVRFANTTPTYENYMLYGSAMLEYKNLKQFLSCYPKFSESNSDNAKIRYIKDIFFIEFNGLFYAISNSHNMRFVVDASKEFDGIPGNNYQITAHSSTVVFYKTFSAVIYPKLATYLRNQSILTDCYFQFE